ncbi:TetR/AcrR family transcriptional regulator [Kitasatospora paracochleata]|uniref:AcrR family transcriptional regulator n=1 Tax=Kitasatospora paracochleata TaxID=58354 RepID=A0ABT1J3L1_9ACTN|nr:TetR/AcrR family transcriptional regulator [Kitasatospora paracochleata]MCP2311744.1 AcrR family transcriptional regulator [Kitasatospora paracochleata]
MAPAPNPDLRNQRSHRAILDAALELAARDGYAKVTVEAIAAAAGVGKQTIYRWWPSKAAVILEALNDRTGPFSGVPDTGDIAADIAVAAQGVIEALGTGLGTIWRGLVADAQGDPRLAESLLNDFMEPRNKAWQDRLDKAVAAGELRADVPTRTMVELLFGPIYYRLLLGTDPLDPDNTTTRVDYLLNGLRPH